MSNHSKGFLVLPRSVFDSWIFTDPFIFYAWMDLIGFARYEDTFQIIDMKKIEVKRGQMVASQRFLAERWKCSVGKVNKVLKLFKDEKMISINREHSISLITVEKYSDYQDLSKYRERSVNTARTQNDTKRNKVNKENKRENPNQDFFNDKAERISYLKKFIDKGFSKDHALKEINKFVNYWTESNPGSKKQRWEMQKTFDVSRRLTTWMNRSKEWQSQKRMTPQEEDRIRRREKQDSYLKESSMRNDRMREIKEQARQLAQKKSV